MIVTENPEINHLPSPFRKTPNSGTSLRVKLKSAQNLSWGQVFRELRLAQKGLPNQVSLKDRKPQPEVWVKSSKKGGDCSCQEK